MLAHREGRETESLYCSSCRESGMWADLCAMKSCRRLLMSSRCFGTRSRTWALSEKAPRAILPSPAELAEGATGVIQDCTSFARLLFKSASRTVLSMEPEGRDALYRSFGLISPEIHRGERSQGYPGEPNPFVRKVPARQSSQGRVVGLEGFSTPTSYAGVWECSSLSTISLLGPVKHR